MIEILETGPVNSVQDAGRFGHRASGVSTSGAMDKLALAAANLLAGNPEDAAVIEVQSFPFRLRFHGAARFAVAGADAPMALDGMPLPSWWSAEAQDGQELEIAAPRIGARCCLALAGGIAVPQILGSASTHLRNEFGGHEGRALAAGDRLRTGTPLRLWSGMAGLESATAALPDAGGDTRVLTLRVIAGADHDLFPEDRRAAFWDSEWRISPQSNRSGYRLRGPSLTLPEPVSLYSYGVVPGIVQVPPSGEPIIQMADANTAGGYPRLGGVIEADLWRLAQARPGTRLRFVRADFDGARAALAATGAWLDRIRLASLRIAS